MSTLALSIVSHGQGQLVKKLLSDLASLDFSQFKSVQKLITLNIPEDEAFLNDYIGEVTVFRNARPLGFGSNHNRAFALSNADFFILLNPDIRIIDSFAQHLLQLADKHWGCMAPLVFSVEGKLEDSARYYPSILRIGKRVFLGQRHSDYEIVESTENCLAVDWVAGMFLIFKSEVFLTLQGFDERYFMYLEDADICRRCNQAGFPVLLNPQFSVIHNARRNTFKNINHLVWHLRSMIRFIFGL